MARKCPQFDDLEDATEYARDMRQEIDAWIDGILFRIQPTGSAVVLVRERAVTYVAPDVLSAMIDGLAPSDGSRVFM